MFLKDKKNFFLVLFLLMAIMFLISVYVEYLMFKVLMGLIIVLFIKIKDLDLNLDHYQLKFFYFFVFIYPFLEVFLKIFTRDFYTYGIMNLIYVLANGVEHILVGMAVGVILLPFLVPTMHKLNQKEKLLFFVSVTVLFCILYELLGFYLFFDPNITAYQNVLYPDTMRDITMNILGALGIFILIFKKKK